MSLPVYSRADLSRTVALVAASSPTAVSTSAVAREFRAAAPQGEDHPIEPARRYIGRVIAANGGDRHQIRVSSSRQPGEQKEIIAQSGASDLNRGKMALIGATNFDRKPFEAAVTGIQAEAPRDPAAAQPIERIRKVE